MSIIVAVQKRGRIAVAADSLTCRGSHREDTKNIIAPKLWRLGDSVVGAAGWSVYSNVFDDFAARQRVPRLTDERAIYRVFCRLWKALKERYALVQERRDDEDSPFGSLDATFLIANPRGIFVVDSDMSVMRFRQYYAVGCAAHYAFGALFGAYDRLRDAEAVARHAVEAAMHFDIHCGGEIQTITIRATTRAGRAAYNPRR